MERPPSSPSGYTPHLLIVLNGSTASSQGIGGGDQVVLKFMRLSGFIPDLIVPRSAERLFNPHGRLFLTGRNLGAGLIPMLWLYFLRTIQGVFRALTVRNQYDIALAASGIVVDLLPLAALKARRKGVIIYHLLPERKAVNWQTRLRFWIAAQEHRIAMWWVKHVCDFVVAGNEVTKKQLQAALPGKEVFVHHAGFDAGAIDLTADPPRDPHLACFMGRLTSQKGIFDLLQIMEKISRTDPQLRLVVVGDGPERSALALEIQRRQITSIELKGFVSDQEKYRILKSATYFFFPSYEEGWGIALAEALYCQAHCICYELPHYRGIFADYPSYVPVGDIDAFVLHFEQRRGQGRPVEQREFIRKYHDPIVVRDLAQRLQGLSASSPSSTN